jgi:hypothetical protein
MQEVKEMAYIEEMVRVPTKMKKELVSMEKKCLVVLLSPLFYLS